MADNVNNNDATNEYKKLTFGLHSKKRYTQFEIAHTRTILVNNVMSIIFSFYSERDN